jgi:hypothetical protein
MPHLQRTMDPQTLFTERERVLLQVFFQEINAARVAAGLPARTLPQLATRIKQVLAADRRGGN